VHFLAEFQMARQKAILFTNYSFFLVDMGMIATLPHIKESMLEQELAGLHLENKDSVASAHHTQGRLNPARHYLAMAGSLSTDCNCDCCCCSELGL